MDEDRESTPRLPTDNMIAVSADAVILALICWGLITEYMDEIPRAVLVIAFVIIALNALLVSLGWRMQQGIFRPLRLMAMAGNWALLIVLGLVALLGIALLLGGGVSARSVKALFELTIYVVPIAAIIGLNLKILADAKPPPT
jgi:magnesium-transporting ATPase (P-type)